MKDAGSLEDVLDSAWTVLVNLDQGLKRTREPPRAFAGTEFGAQHVLVREPLLVEGVA